MDLNKIGISLCFAMQEHEGPFYVQIIHPLHQRWIWCRRSEIKQLSDDNAVIFIDLSIPRKDRRWIARTGVDRRA